MPGSPAMGVQSTTRDNAPRKSRSGAAVAFALPTILVALALGGIALAQDGPGSLTAPLLLALAAWAWSMLDDRPAVLRFAMLLCLGVVLLHAARAFGTADAPLAGLLASACAAAAAAAWARSRHATTGTCQVTLMLAAAASAYLAFVGILWPEARLDGGAGTLAVTLPFGTACLMIHRMDWSRPPAQGVLAAAASIGIVAAATLGLWFGAPFVAGYRPDHVQMAGLGSACTTALASALLALEFNHRRLALALAGVPVVVSLYALAARDAMPAFGDLAGIEPLQYWLRAGITPPAAMTLLTCALALGLGTMLRRYRSGATLLWMGGLLAALVATIALVAVLSGVPREAAAAAHSGSIPTVLAMGILGVGMMSSRPVRMVDPTTRERWLPLWVGAVVCTGAAWLANAQYQKDLAERVRAEAVAQNDIADALRSARERFKKVAQPMARAVAMGAGEPPVRALAALAAPVFADDAGLAEVRWVDAEGRLRAAADRSGRGWSSAADGADVPIALAVREMGERGDAVRWIGPYPGPVAGTSRLSLVRASPATRGVVEFLVLSFDAEIWLQDALQGAARDFDIQISFDAPDVPPFSQGETAGRVDWALVAPTQLPLDGMPWSLRLSPSGPAATGSALPPLVLWSGVLIAALLSLTLRLALIGRRRAHAAESANTALQRGASWERAQREALVALATERPIDDVLALVARTFEARFPGARCCVLGIAQPGGPISTVVAPSLPPEWAPYWRDRMPSAQAGGGGTCLHRNGVVVTGDVEFDELWEGHRGAARAAGVRSAWAAPIRDAQGCTLGAFEVCRADVRAPDAEEREALQSVAALAGVVFDRETARARVEVSRQWFKSLFERSPNAVMAVGLDGRIVDCNERTVVRSGLRREALMNMPIEAVVGPEQRDEVRRRFALACAGEAQSFETAARLPQGVRDTQATLVPIAVGGSIVGVFVIAADVTERNRVQRELQQALVDLRQRNRELQDFAFVATHDLQEPLRKIQAFSDRVLQRFAPLIPEPGPDYLRRIDASAHRMQVLIDDLLAYSRVATTGADFGDVDLGEVVRDVLADLELRIEESGAQVEVGSLPRVHGDRTQLRQLMQNLLANALKFRDRSRTPRIHIDAAPAAAPGRVRVVVADNGIGFDPVHAERIFVPFQRLHTADAYGGTGIGLAVVRRIVERHGGTVIARGEPGHGSRFEIDLPAGAAQADDGRAPEMMRAAER